MGELRSGDIVAALGFKGHWLKISLSEEAEGSPGESDLPSGGRAGLRPLSEAWVLHLHQELGLRILAPLLKGDELLLPRPLVGGVSRSGGGGGLP